MTVSTGMSFCEAQLLAYITRNNPFPANVISPTGPLKLSTHPEIGSFNEDVTITNRIYFLDHYKVFHNKQVPLQ